LTSLGPSIYKLTKNLKFLKFELWLSSVRTEVSQVRTVFYDILLETAQFYHYQVHVQTAWPSVRTVFVVSPFRPRKGNSKYSGMLDIVRTSCKNFINSIDCWNPTPCRNLRSLTYRPDDVALTSRRLQRWSFWTLRGVRTPSKARPDGCTGTDYSDLKIIWNLHGHLLRTCNHTHGMKLDTVHITWRHWIEPIILLKSNRYIKCFCQPKCCQYKILTRRKKSRCRRFNLYRVRLLSVKHIR